MNQNLLANRYRIVQKLGSGGFGDTFLAEDTHLPSGRICVIKQLRPMNNNPRVYQLVKERFQREAVILEDLGNSHRQIPTLFAYFEDEGQFYLVQEYIQGKTLSTLFKEQGRQSETFVKEFLINLLVVLEYIQTKRVIHRDIKPDNIIVRQSDGTPVLIDFGAMRETMGTEISPSGNSTHSIVIGTPGFMPPEQSIGRPVFSSDLYALGLTAIYLLTGKSPQELETEPLTGEICWRQYILNINPILANVIDQSIKSQASLRFTTAQLMREALQEQPIVLPTTSSLLSLPLLLPNPKQRIADWLKIAFAGGGIAIIFLAAWSFLSQEQQSQLAKKNSEVKVIPESKNDRQTEQQQELGEQKPQSPQEQSIVEAPYNQATSESKNNQQIEERSQLKQTQQELEQQLEAAKNIAAYRNSSLIWRSQSNLTRIVNLNQICLGTSTLNSVQTVFGYNKSIFVGKLIIPSPKISGCTTGDILQGNFELSGNTGNCSGMVKITWKNNDNAFIEWNISNLGSACPVGRSDWKINTYPVQL